MIPRSLSGSRRLALALLCLMAAGARAGASTPADDLKAIEKAWDEAYRARDTATLDRLLAADYRLTDASGAVLDRGQYLSSVVKSPDFSRVDSYASEGLEVRVYGEAAVVTGLSPVKGRARGRAQAFSGRYRFTDVWVKHQDRWEAVATQSTSVPAARP